jgi:hypothetical protein
MSAKKWSDEDEAKSWCAAAEIGPIVCFVGGTPGE